MLAVLNHRAAAYHELNTTRSTLMHLRQQRSGLFIKKGQNAHNCWSVMALLADIAAAKFEELRVLLSLDWIEKKLVAEKQHHKMNRVMLGSNTSSQPDMENQSPAPRRVKRMDGVTAYLLARLMMRPRV